MSFWWCSPGDVVGIAFNVDEDTKSVLCCSANIKICMRATKSNAPAGLMDVAVGDGLLPGARP